MSFPARAHAKQRSASARAEEGQKVQENEGGGRGRGNTMTESKKINFCFNYKADKTLGSSEHSKGGQVAAWSSPKVNRALVRAHPQSPPSPSTTHTTHGTRLVASRNMSEGTEREAERGGTQTDSGLDSLTD